MNKKACYPKIRATKFLRKMHGASQSCLLQASDGNFYIAKLLGNPQGSKVLFNEAFGTELMQKLGFSVPNWIPIEISTEFIDRNSQMWFDSGVSEHQWPPAGIHFASEFPAANLAETIYEILPRNWLGRITNREAFVGALLFDLWAGQTDNRQAIFMRSPGESSLDAVFIDQGGLFGNTQDPQITDLIRAMYMDPIVYAGLDFDALVPVWESRIRNLNFIEICSSIYSMAGIWQWYTPVNFDQMVLVLREGQASLKRYSRLIKLALKSPGDALRNVQHKRIEDIQILSPQLRANSNKRIGGSVSRTG